MGGALEPSIESRKVLKGQKAEVLRTVKEEEKKGNIGRLAARESSHRQEGKCRMVVKWSGDR